MGCDIHLYPEARRLPDGEWFSVAGSMNPGRDYDLFGKIAGLRSSEPSMYEVRGLPGQLGFWARSDNQIFITADGGGDYATLAEAERWVASGSSEWTDERKVFVTHPDWHSHTHLSVAEMRSALEAPSKWGERDVEYWGVLAMMEEIERRGHEGRFVIWFDN